VGFVTKQRVLVVEDEKNISQLIQIHLEKEGLAVEACFDGESALQSIKKERPDLICLDILLPGISGLQLCQYLKANEAYKDIPILIVSALGEEDDVVKGLDLGADDYVAKPFSPKIFRARVNSVLRRSMLKESKSTEALDTVELGPIRVDRRKHQVFIDGEERGLTATEFAILSLMIESPGVVYTRSQIVNSIRGDNHAITDRSVDFQMVGLRRKMEPHGNFVEAVRGVGYRFKEIDD